MRNTMFQSVRFSPTRESGAVCTACTKLTREDHDALHWMALERGLSDYELTRRVLVEYVRGRAPSAGTTEAERE